MVSRICSHHSIGEEDKHCHGDLEDEDDEHNDEKLKKNRQIKSFTHVKNLNLYNTFSFLKIVSQKNGLTLLNTHNQEHPSFFLQSAQATNHTHQSEDASQSDQHRAAHRHDRG